MAGFIYKLQNVINASPESNDADINIARCLLKNINYIKKKQLSLQELADICYTSKASISRFSQKMGYSNFNEFKLDCIGIQEELNEMIIDNHALQKTNMLLFSQKLSQCFHETHHENLIQSLNEICKLIYQANRVIIFATHIPGDIANILQWALLTTGRYVEFYPRKEHQIEVVKQVKQDDLCIFISLEGTLLMEKSITIPAIISMAKTVLITQNSHTKFHEQFTQTITLGHHDEENLGKYKLLFFIDCLINHYYNQYVVSHH